MTPMSVLVVLLTAVVALLAVLVAGLLRSHAEILRALHDLGAGLDPAPGEPPRRGWSRARRVDQPSGRRRRPARPPRATPCRWR